MKDKGVSLGQRRNATRMDEGVLLDKEGVLLRQRRRVNMVEEGVLWWRKEYY